VPAPSGGPTLRLDGSSLPHLGHHLVPTGHSVELPARLCELARVMPSLPVGSPLPCADDHPTVRRSQQLSPDPARLLLRRDHALEHDRVTTLIIGYAPPLPLSVPHFARAADDQAVTASGRLGVDGGVGQRIRQLFPHEQDLGPGAFDDMIPWGRVTLARSVTVSMGSPPPARAPAEDMPVIIPPPEGSEGRDGAAWCRSRGMTYRAETPRRRYRTVRASARPGDAADRAGSGAAASSSPPAWAPGRPFR
jgi:hypothetical protein